MSIKLKNITIDYGNFLAVNDLNININKGELVSLLGPSGCGKTTALNAIAGLINTTSGQILFDGVDVTHKASQKRNIGLVFQSYALYSHMTVFKNIAYPLYHSKEFKKELKRDNFKYKQRLEALKATKGLKIVLEQQQIFLSELSSFLKKINQKFQNSETIFLKNHKQSIIDYTNQLFNDFENAEVLKNHMITYLYDKLKIKFNELETNLERKLSSNYDLLLSKKIDVRFKNTLAFYSWKNKENLLDNEKHLKELKKTSRNTKKQIKKQQKQLSNSLNIFSNTANDLYSSYLQEKSIITEKFVLNEIKAMENEIDDFFFVLSEKVNSPVVENSKLSSSIKYIEDKINGFKILFMLKQQKELDKYIKQISKVLNNFPDLIEEIKVFLSNQLEIELNSIVSNFENNVEERFAQFLNTKQENMFTKVSKYYEFNFQKKSNKLENFFTINDKLQNSISEKLNILDEKTIFEVNQLQVLYIENKNSLTDSLIVANVEKIESMIEAKFNKMITDIQKEINELHEIVDTREEENILRQNIFTKKRKIRTLVLETAKQVEIETQLQKKPSELSGGQQQRVAIARAIVKKPSILLMDEPLSNLDAKLRLTTREWIKRFQQKVGITTIFVTHDQEEAMSISDSIFVMNKGVLQQGGTPLEIYNRPTNEFVAKFIGTPNINFLDVEVKNSSFKLPSNEVLSFKDLSISKEIWKLGIRPERISAVKGKGKIHIGTGEVIVIEQLGKQNHVKVKLTDEIEITLIIEPHEWEKLPNNKTLSLYTRKEDLYLFDTTTKLVEVKYA